LDFLIASVFDLCILDMIAMIITLCTGHSPLTSTRRIVFPSKVCW
jgi:hypothetical protein